MRARAQLFGLVLLCLTPDTAGAQEPATLSGQITTAPDGQPLPGATVSIPSLGLSIITDQEGRYSLTIPADRNKNQTVELRVSFTGLPTKTIQLTLAPGTLTRDVEVGLGFFEEITVGSRTAGVAAEKSVPVDVLTVEQIATAGAVETNQIIQALAPSFNFPRPTITDGTDSRAGPRAPHARAAQFRHHVYRPQTHIIPTAHLHPRRSRMSAPAPHDRRCATRR
jgi:hypothetical protein